MIRLREEEGGLLSVIPGKAEMPPKMDEAVIRVSPSDNVDLVIRKTVSTYLIGYNIIHLRAERQQQLTIKQRQEIKNFARHMLVGTEIVIDTPSDLTLQVLLSYP